MNDDSRPDSAAGCGSQWQSWDDLSAGLDVCEAELGTMEAARDVDLDKDGSCPFEFYNQFLAHYGPLVTRTHVKGDDVDELCPVDIPRYRRVPSTFAAPLRRNHQPHVSRMPSSVSGLPVSVAGLAARCGDFERDYSIGLSVPSSRTGASRNREMSRKRLRESTQLHGICSRRRLLSNYWTTESLLRAGIMCAADLSIVVSGTTAGTTRGSTTC